MQITKDKVAGIHYTLRDNTGTIIDTSEGREPLYYLHGAGNLIIGMEEGLEGKSTGDKFQLRLFYLSQLLFPLFAAALLILQYNWIYVVPAYTSSLHT